MSEWVILELGPMAESEDPDLIAAAIKNLVRDAEVFIPAAVTQVGDDRVVTYLVDGYAFIRRSLPDQRYLRLEDTRYVATVVRKPGTGNKQLAYVTDRDIDKFRRQIRAYSDQGIDIGDTVVVTSGPYKGLQAVVVEDIPEVDSVQVRIELRSKDSLVTLPRSFTRLVTRAATPSFVARLRHHREWFNGARAVVGWSGDLSEVRRLHGQHQRLTRWLADGRCAQAFIRLDGCSSRVEAMRKKHRSFLTLHRWVKVGASLQNAVRAIGLSLDPQPLYDKLGQLDTFNRWCGGVEKVGSDVRTLAGRSSCASLETLQKRWSVATDTLTRFLDLVRSVQSIERELEGVSVVENVIIDGLNMAARCSLAPGLSELRDSTGRPTGAIVGFMNSLAALRKRFPVADFWVCWDSFSTRRKEQYAAYKANRNPLRTTFEVGYLKELLSSFGVWQVSCQGEEADDVIASLVKGRLAGQHNLVVSNDRDFMQLVDDRTHVMVPAVGVGKEKLCTPEQVKVDYGVCPDKMVYLRALGGDTSDNIPGAPGCGVKTASKLLNLYGTVDGIFSSNLAGLSQGLREKLRAAEDQVRLNVTLMSLIRDLPLSPEPPNPNVDQATRHLENIGMTSSRVVPAFFTRQLALGV